MTSTRRGKQKVTYQPRPCPCQRPFSDPSTVAKGTASRAPSISNSPIWPHPIGKICPFTIQLTNNSTWAAWAETAETLRPMSGADSQSHLCWPAPGALSRCTESRRMRNVQRRLQGNSLAPPPAPPMQPSSRWPGSSAQSTGAEHGQASVLAGSMFAKFCCVGRIACGSVMPVR